MAVCEDLLQEEEDHESDNDKNGSDACKLTMPWMRRRNSFRQSMSQARDRAHHAMKELEAVRLRGVGPVAFGAFTSLFKAVAKSLCVIIPTVISWRIVATVVAVAALLLYFMPLAAFIAVDVGSLLIIVIVEAIFFVRLRMVRKRLREVRPLEQRLPAPTGAADLFFRAMESVEACGRYRSACGASRSVIEWIEAWFLGAPVAQIKRGNITEFLAWAFFTKYPEEMSEEERGLLDDLVNQSERRLQLTWEEGYNPETKCIRINFDPLHVWSHPFLYYAAVRTLVAATRQTLRLVGFSYHCLGTDAERFSYFHCAPPPRLGTVIVGGKPTETQPKLPIVFLHGLGTGLSPYLRLLLRIASERELFMIELPEISQVGVEKGPLPNDMAEKIQGMLQAHGHEQACFVAHSYGTVVLSWVIRARKSMVAKAVFLDPVCFLLVQPDVAFNVLYRKPKNWFMTCAANIAFWELYTANTLMRNFYWYHNVLWLDELPEKTVVVLASHDDICDAWAVKCYLEEHQKRQPDLQLLWFQNFIHGEILLSRSAQIQIMELL
mmetsp:Transcript_614/g.1255  ORF Transcript_614/g.1255 Transcript_614/m.1255 type:complete len:550 (+) Transcript_614:258-1907(+)